MEGRTNSFIAFMVLPALAMLCAMPVYAQVDLTGKQMDHYSWEKTTKEFKEYEMSKYK